MMAAATSGELTHLAEPVSHERILQDAELLTGLALLLIQSASDFFNPARLFTFNDFEEYVKGRIETANFSDGTPAAKLADLLRPVMTESGLFIFELIHPSTPHPRCFSIQNTQDFLLVINDYRNLLNCSDEPAESFVGQPRCYYLEAVIDAVHSTVAAKASQFGPYVDTDSGFSKSLHTLFKATTDCQAALFYMLTLRAQYQAAMNSTDAGAPEHQAAFFDGLNSSATALLSRVQGLVSELNAILAQPLAKLLDDTFRVSDASPALDTRSVWSKHCDDQIIAHINDPKWRQSMKKNVHACLIRLTAQFEDLFASMLNTSCVREWTEDASTDASELPTPIEEEAPVTNTVGLRRGGLLRAAAFFEQHRAADKSERCLIGFLIHRYINLINAGVDGLDERLKAQLLQDIADLYARAEGSRWFGGDVLEIVKNILIRQSEIALFKPLLQELGFIDSDRFHWVFHDLTIGKYLEQQGLAEASCLLDHPSYCKFIENILECGWHHESASIEVDSPTPDCP